ncbi:MAG: hypothetical protein AAFR75_12190, partial [Pseudomonadota bacterium]
VTLERRTMLDTVEPVEVVSPKDEKQTVTLEKASDGVWRSTIDVKIPGLYKATTPGPIEPLTAVALAGTQDAREMSEVTATSKKLKPIQDASGGGAFWTAGTSLLTAAKSATDVTVPRVTMLSGARVFSGSNWMALRDRQAYLTKGVKITPMFEGLLALAALLFVISLAWWREGR